MVKYLLKKLTRTLLFTLCICGWYHLYAQANFVAICPQKKIGKNDFLQVEFRLENASDIQSIDPPTFKDFSVVSGPNQATSSSNINGKMDQSVSVSYILKPNASGNYTIPSATAKADGKEFHTDPLNIQVTKSATVSSSTSSLNNSMSPLANFNFDINDEPMGQEYDDYILKKGDDINDKIKKNLFVKTDINKTKCYVGEPIVATFKIYTRLRLETNVTSEPSFNGFSVTEMPLNNRNSSSIEKYNGREYNVYTLRKVQLFPLQAGAITIDPLVTENNITFVKADYAASQSGDPFLDMMRNFANAMPQQGSLVQQHASVQSSPIEITVKPLPDTNKPSNYKGAVGVFNIQSSLEKNKFTTDDAGNLNIQISGAGNIQMINAPKIDWPKGVDGYDAKAKDTINKNSVPLNGSKLFTYPFTIANAGTYTIPSISFSFFDPALGKYKNLETQPLTVTVEQGKGIHSELLTIVSNKGADAWSEIKKYGLFGILGIVTVAGIIVLFKRNKPIQKSTTVVTDKQTKKDNIIEKENIESSRSLNPLPDIYKKLQEGNSSAFYQTMDVSLKNYLGEKLHIPVSELSKKRINEELDKRNIGIGTLLRLTSLMDNIEQNLYAPLSGLNEMANAYERASEVFSLLDKQC